MKTTVVNLGIVKDMLAELDRVRQHVLSGNIAGFQSVFCDSQGGETIFLAGAYKHDPKQALAASLKLSAARALAEDEPPKLKTGS